MNISNEWCVYGEKIADDCYSNGLCTGERVNLSEILGFIRKTHTHNAGAVESGFLSKMKTFVDTGGIEVFNGENDEVIFIHRNHVNDQLS